MGTEQEKSIIELSVFHEFVKKSGLPVNLSSIHKCSGHCVPDIKCELLGEGFVAFELVEICNQELAERISYVRSGGEFQISSEDNLSQQIVRNKLGKSYQTDLPLELLCYTNGRVIAPDDVILSDIRSVLNKSQGQFRRIWLLGEKDDVYEVWKIATPN